METKKKLMLGPLPEQKEDYSAYEETVVRWDRIIAAGLACLLLVALSLYYAFFQTSPHSSPKFAEDLSSENKGMIALEQTQENLVSETSTDDQTLSSAVDQADDVQTLETIEQSVIDKPERVNDKSIADEVLVARAEKTADKTGLNSDISIEAINEVLPATSSAPYDAAMQISIQAEQQPQQALAKLEILDGRIEAAVLSSNVANGVPGEPLLNTVSTGSEGIIKVAMFNEMLELKGETLYHEWYRNGRLQATVKIPVNVDGQKSYSSKFINKDMLGDWSVLVRDKTGKQFVTAEFKVVSD